MEPINMIIIYYSDKKLPKILHFLEADMIAIAEDLRSAQRIHLLQHMFQMTAVASQTHLKPTSEVDFYLWVSLKDHVYENRPQSIAELKAAITQKSRAIRKEECVRVTDNFLSHQRN